MVSPLACSGTGAYAGHDGHILGTAGHLSARLCLKKDVHLFSSDRLQHGDHRGWMHRAYLETQGVGCSNGV